MANVWIPNHDVIQAPTFASRAIAVLALGLLSDRNRSYQQTLLQQQAKLQAQEKLRVFEKISLLS